MIGNSDTHMNKSMATKKLDKIIIVFYLFTIFLYSSCVLSKVILLLLPASRISNGTNIPFIILYFIVTLFLALYVIIIILGKYLGERLKTVLLTIIGICQLICYSFLFMLLIIQLLIVYN
jgi:hypothetical protein